VGCVYPILVLYQLLSYGWWFLPPPPKLFIEW
jgi:hypothetical protein